MSANTSVSTTWALRSKKRKKHGKSPGRLWRWKRTTVAWDTKGQRSVKASRSIRWRCSSSTQRPTKTRARTFSQTNNSSSHFHSLPKSHPTPSSHKLSNIQAQVQPSIVLTIRKHANATRFKFTSLTMGWNTATWNWLSVWFAMEFTMMKGWIWKSVIIFTGARLILVSRCLISGWRCSQMARKFPKETWRRCYNSWSKTTSPLSLLKSSRGHRASITLNLSRNLQTRPSSHSPSTTHCPVQCLACHLPNQLLHLKRLLWFGAKRPWIATRFHTTTYWDKVQHKRLHKDQAQTVETIHFWKARAYSNKSVIRMKGMSFSTLMYEQKGRIGNLKLIFFSFFVLKYSSNKFILQAKQKLNQ